MNVHQRVAHNESAFGHLRALQLYEQMAAEEIPHLYERLYSKRLVADEAEYRRLLRELKKYFALCASSSEPLGMPSPQVDEVWHNFILFTRQYKDFTEKFLGRFLHHAPDTSDEPTSSADYDRFVALYTETFGELDPVWGEGVLEKKLKFHQGEGATCKGCNNCKGCRADGCSGCGNG